MDWWNIREIGSFSNVTLYNNKSARCLSIESLCNPFFSIPPLSKCPGSSLWGKESIFYRFPLITLLPLHVMEKWSCRPLRWELATSFCCAQSPLLQSNICLPSWNLTFPEWSQFCSLRNSHLFDIAPKCLQNFPNEWERPFWFFSHHTIHCLLCLWSF